jgi:ferrous-iron efflux pump FieF
VTEKARLTVNAALASVAAALFLLVLKAAAAWETGSVAMLGSLADTALDLLAALVTLYGVRVAATPADHDHRFGHGKAEALAALFQVALITASAAVIAWRAIERLTYDQRATDAEFGVGRFPDRDRCHLCPACLSAPDHRPDRLRRDPGRQCALSERSAAQPRRRGRLAARPDRGLTGADPIFGIAIALWLAWGAFKASSQAIDQLMDKEWPEEKRQRFLEAAARHPELRGIHDFRTRRSGSRDFAQFHMYVARNMTVEEAHGVMDEVEARIAEEFPGVEVLIHLDPEGHVDHPGNHLVEADVTPIRFGKRP